VIHGIWEEFLTIVKEEAGSRVVDTWFKAVSLYQWNDIEQTVYLEAPNPFVRDWVKSNYLELIQTHLGRLLHVQAPKVIFLTADAHKTTKSTDDIVLLTPTHTKSPSISDSTKRSLMKIPGRKKRSYINKNYLFKTLVVGPSNSLAYAAAQAITEKLGRLYNPLFIFGESGLGKTHLLHAIGNEVLDKYDNAVVLYQTADRFVHEFISAIRFDKIHKFKAKYKEVDVLLIDDIQFIANKEQTQEAFFHIFNSLYDAHKQIVFSSDTFPQNIDGLAERLRSRLASGLVADIHMPSLEIKIAILKKKAALSNEVLADDVAQFIASQPVGSVRELEGALIRVIAFGSFTKQPITLELAQKVLDHVVERKNTEVDFNRIVKCVCKHYSLNKEQIFSKNRNKELVLARQVAMYLMKKITDKSLRDIGDFLGGRDHSTVKHALNRIDRYSKLNPDFNTTLKRIQDDIL